jgi:hypothetical protein
MKRLLPPIVLSLAVLCAGCSRTEGLDLSGFQEFEFQWVPVIYKSWDPVQRYVIRNEGAGRYTLHLAVYSETDSAGAGGQELPLEELPPQDLSADEVTRMLEIFSRVERTSEILPTYGTDIAPFPEWRWDDLVLGPNGIPKMGQDSWSEIITFLWEITPSLR